VRYAPIQIWSHVCSCSPQGSASPCAEAVSMFWHTTVTTLRANMEQGRVGEGGKKHAHTRVSSCITLWCFLIYWNSLNMWCGWTLNDLNLNIRHRIQKWEHHMEQHLSLKVYGYSDSNDIFCFYWIHKSITILKKSQHYSWPWARWINLYSNFSRRNFNIIVMPYLEVFQLKLCLNLIFPKCSARLIFLNLMLE
jgi:hypothetical protein